MMKPLCYALLILTSLVTGCKSYKVTPQQAVEKLGTNPYFEIDAQSADKGILNEYDPKDIATLATYFGRDATKRFGEKAKDGAVIIETRKFAIEKYETMLKSASSAYAKMIAETRRDDIQYILNDRILVDNFEGDLASLNAKLLKSVHIINEWELTERFQIHKKIGVIIQAKRPKNVYNSKEKF